MATRPFKKCRCNPCLSLPKLVLPSKGAKRTRYVCKDRVLVAWGGASGKGGVSKVEVMALSIIVNPDGRKVDWIPKILDRSSSSCDDSSSRVVCLVLLGTNVAASWRAILQSA
jgi:hypothetical protein